jgi:cytochrome c peroxidase
VEFQPKDYHLPNQEPFLERNRNAIVIIGLFVVALAAIFATSQLIRSRQQADLRNVVANAGITSLNFGTTPDLDKVVLGEALFFDKEVSGNRDISCATCHHPTAGSGDDLALSLGTGGVGLGLLRVRGEGREFIPRNAPEIFNRAAEGWETMFWDARVSGSLEEGFHTPAKSELPDGLDSILAAQAMFPPTSGDEMRGKPGDVDVFGNENELALLEKDDFAGIWGGIMDRLLAIPEYQEMFHAAYPDIDMEDLGFQHAANAIAAYEQFAFTFDDSPWDRYVAGIDSALSEEAKAGALLFYGKAECSSCHAGNLFTDQDFHNIAVPQLGPGKNNEEGFDFGRFNETNENTAYFAFRTPPLRNVATTGPWMHNGAYSTLEATIQHHLDPSTALPNYDPFAHLPQDLAETCKLDPDTVDTMLSYLDPSLQTPIVLTDQEISHLVAFLESLTSPGSLDMQHLVPESVPSQLAVAD